MDTNTLREKYLEFFKSKGHAIIGSSSLIPENDPTVLFTTAGVHPLVPFVLGEKHPSGKRIASCQKCVRTGDIDEVGDSSHLTFFEMLGNWSFGDYFKKEAMSWALEFLTSKEWLNLDQSRLAFTCFEGDISCPKDEEAISIWLNLGIKSDKIFLYGKKENWWGPAGSTGPCGPDTEIFWETNRPACGKSCSPSCNCGHYMEIWNLVFMQYNKQSNGTLIPLETKIIDTGMGLARTSTILQDLTSVYETDLYSPLVKIAKKMSAKSDDLESIHVVVDHITAAVFIISDGVRPSNLGAGYILRRLLRRIFRRAKKLGSKKEMISKLIETNFATYGKYYPELKNMDIIKNVITEEEKGFSKALASGLKQFEKMIQNLETSGSNQFSGSNIFTLYATFGFPPELTKELCKEKNFKFDEAGFQKELEKHATVSQPSQGEFKGGLSDHTQETTKLHTATHILNQALRNVLGSNVYQSGSNITPKRLRFDFTFDRKLTQEEKTKIEQEVQKVIDANMSVSFEEMTLDEAKSSGAIGVFDDRYGEKVKVYSIQNFSKEICGGPHVSKTGTLGKFKIVSEKASSAGVRRIKAILELK